jgi:hypothetical protein
MYLSAMPPPQEATFMTAFSYFLPENLLSVTAQLQELKVK